MLFLFSDKLLNFSIIITHIIFILYTLLIFKRVYIYIYFLKVLVIEFKNIYTFYLLYIKNLKLYFCLFKKRIWIRSNELNQKEFHLLRATNFTLIIDSKRDNRKSRKISSSCHEVRKLTDINKSLNHQWQTEPKSIKLIMSFFSQPDIKRVTSDELQFLFFASLSLT